jgi:phosphoglycerate kinase
MAPFRTLDQADVFGARVLLRVDLNVPIDNGRVTDATRLGASCRPSPRSPTRAAR